MANATQDREARRKDSDLIQHLLGAATRIFKNTLVSARNDGYTYPSRSGTATDAFLGVARSRVDNSTGNAGDKTINVEKEGAYVFSYAPGGATQALVGTAVYAADDQSVTNVANNNQLAGYVCEIISATEVRVRIDNAVR